MTTNFRNSGVFVQTVTPTGAAGARIDDNFKALLEQGLGVVQAPVAAATDIQAGDLLWLNSAGEAEPASTFAFDTSNAETRALFVEAFLGVALDASPVGDTTYVKVATRGTFPFSETSGNMQELGALMGPTLNAAGTFLERGKVARVSSSYLAVGRIAEPSDGQGAVRVAILSTVMCGGVPGSDPQHMTRA